VVVTVASQSGQPRDDQQPSASDRYIAAVSASDRVARARLIETPSEAVSVYRDWAADYDDDVFGSLGFTGGERIADLLAEHVIDRRTSVIDLGCGTGAVGVRLRVHGFEEVDGVDISPEMLAQAAAKHAYRSLLVADLLDRIPLADRSYGAAISAGTFTSGHVGPAAVPEIVRVLRPGAVVAWVVALSMWPQFEPAAIAAGLDVVHRAAEPIRRSGAPEATMLVARLRR